MPKSNNQKGGPSQSPKDEPTADRDTRHAQSNDELSDRTEKRGDTPARGGRNGSQKHR